MIALKSCRVSDYNGKSLNASSHAEDIYIGSIRHERAEQLKAWIEGNSVHELRGNMRSLGDDYRPDGEKRVSSTPTVLIS